MPEPDPPRVVIMAGSNGAGKTTASRLVLQGALGVDEYVNADAIARGLSAFTPERAALAAGRIMLKRLGELADQRGNFAFETTLASRSFAPWLRKLIATGYQFHLIYLWLPDPEMSVTRVKHRVKSGGHHVAPDVVRQRYQAGLRNFFELYAPISTSWGLFDNSQNPVPAVIAQGQGVAVELVSQSDLWAKIQAQGGLGRE